MARRLGVRSPLLLYQACSVKVKPMTLRMRAIAWWCVESSDLISRILDSSDCDRNLKTTTASSPFDQSNDANVGTATAGTDDDMLGVLLSAHWQVLLWTGEAAGTTNNVDLGSLAIFPVSNSSVAFGKRQYSPTSGSSSGCSIMEVHASSHSSYQTKD